MTYSIPTNYEELRALRQKSVNEELVAAAICGTIQIARDRGQSLDEIRTEVLEDCGHLNPEQRQWLSEIVGHAWQSWQEELPVRPSAIASSDL